MEQIEKIESTNNIDRPRLILSHSQLGLIIIMLGVIEIIVGIFSWFFTIPIFSLFYFGEIIGLIFIVVGVKQFFKGKR